MFKNEEGAGILGCVGSTPVLGISGAACGGVLGVIAAFVMNLLAICGAGVAGFFVPCALGGCVLPWAGLTAFAPVFSCICVPVTTVLALAGGVAGALVGMCGGCLTGLFADWAMTCGVISSTCHQAIGRTMGGLFGAMGK